MTSEDTGGSEEGAPGGRRRRPPSTIELEASEVATEPASAGDEPQPTPDTEPTSEPGRPETESHPQAPVARTRSMWGLIGAGLAGAIIAGCIFGGLWISGVLRGADESDDEWAALPDKVAVLERQVGELAGRMQALPDSRRTEDIDARLKKLEMVAASPGAPPGDPALAQKIADLDRRIEQALAAVNEAKARADAAASQAQKADAEATGNPAERAALEALAARVASLEQQRKADEQRFGRVAAGVDRAVRLAVVATELRVAVERGAPFAAELAAAKQLAADPSTLAPLEPAAATGVPAPVQLAQNLSKLAPAMLKAASAPRREAGVIERLQASAERLVRIRPVDEAPGDEPSTLIARAELKATRGDIAGALADVERLPEQVRAPAAAWIEAAKSRIAAVEAAKKLAANALEALARPAE
jgi:hypothetical protein